jgi:hypothetical protein
MYCSKRWQMQLVPASSLRPAQLVRQRFNFWKSVMAPFPLAIWLGAARS